MNSNLIKFSELKQIEKLSSGVFIFDLLTQGGIPEGKFTLFIGDKSTSKTTFSLRLIDRFLKKYPNKEACYLDFENAIDTRWVTTIIEDTDRLRVAQPIYIEEGLDIIRAAVNDENVSFFVIDSLATMISVEEGQGEADKTYVGMLARSINAFFRKVLPLVVQRNRDNNPITVILINQLRSSIGQPSYIPSYSLPGGKFQEALASMIVRFYGAKIEKKADIPSIAEFPFVVEKNKVGGVPKVAGKYSMALTNSTSYKIGEVINEPVILDYMKTYEIIKKDKNKYFVLDKVFNTQTEIKQELRQNQEFVKQIFSVIQEKFINYDM